MEPCDNDTSEYSDYESENMDSVGRMPSSLPNIRTSYDTSPHRMRSASVDRFRTVQRRKLTKLMDLESSSGGLIDRNVRRSSINMVDLMRAKELGADDAVILDVLKFGRKSPKLSNISTIIGAPMRNIGTSSVSDTFRVTPIYVRLHLKWNNVKYEVRVKGGTKEILHGISGEAHPGEMLALMGSSGAGKTTLLNILAGRVATGKISGDILVNGKKRDVHSWKHMIGYVEQEDVMYGTLTVKETLYYAALLRLPPYLTHKQKKERAIQVMTELGLSDSANTRIGDGLSRGVSGGEKKRVAIGIELVANPGLLFLDEPTSGLDSYVAYNIMEAISILALRELKTIIATIHQPREDILFLFDKLLLITKGQCVYFGPTIDSITWFNKLGYKCPTFVNPADFVIDLISVDTRTPELRQKSLERIDVIVRSWKDTEKYPYESLSINIENSELEEGYRLTSEQENDENETVSVHTRNPALSMLATERQAKQMRKILSSDKQISPRNPWIDEFCILFKRSCLNQVRDMSLIYSLLAQVIMITLLVGFSFFQLPLTQAGAQARVGVLFFYSGAVMSNTMQSLSFVFPSERRVTNRERYAGSFRVSSYYVAKAVSLFPLRTFAMLAYVCGSYYIVGLNPGADRFFTMIGIMIDMMFCSCAIGLFIGAVSKTEEHAHIVSIVVVIILYIYTGNLAPVSIIPPELSWLQYVSFMKYAYSAVMQNELDGLVFLCQNDQPPVDGTCNPGFATGEQVLQQYDLLQFDISTNCLAIMGFGFLYNVMAYLAVKFMFRPKTRL